MTSLVPPVFVPVDVVDLVPGLVLHLAQVGTAGVDLDSVVDVVVPVDNKEVDLGPSVRRLDCSSPSTSPTGSASPSPTTRAPTPPGRGRESWRPSCPAYGGVHLSEKGRGLALKMVWSASAAPVLPP